MTDGVDEMLAAIERADYERRRGETLRMVEFIEASAAGMESEVAQWREHAAELRERWGL